MQLWEDGKFGPTIYSESSFLPRFLKEVQVSITIRSRLTAAGEPANEIRFNRVVGIVPVKRGDNYFPGIVVEKIQGTTLDKIKFETAERPTGIRALTSEFAKVAGQMDLINALYYRGQEGAVIHRDIKLGNIMMMDDGKLMVIDYGNAARPWDFTPTNRAEIIASTTTAPVEQLYPDIKSRNAAGTSTDQFSMVATWVRSLAIAAGRVDHLLMYRTQNGINGVFDYLSKAIRSNQVLPTELDTQQFKHMLINDYGLSKSKAAEIAGIAAKAMMVDHKQRHDRVAEPFDEINEILNQEEPPVTATPTTTKTTTNTFGFIGRLMERFRRSGR